MPFILVLSRTLAASFTSPVPHRADRAVGYFPIVNQRTDVAADEKRIDSSGFLFCAPSIGKLQLFAKTDEPFNQPEKPKKSKRPETTARDSRRGTPGVSSYTRGTLRFLTRPAVSFCAETNIKQPRRRLSGHNAARLDELMEDLFLFLFDAVSTPVRPCRRVLACLRAPGRKAFSAQGRCFIVAMFYFSSGALLNARFDEDGRPTAALNNSQRRVT